MRRLNLKDVQIVATKRGGKCLSKVYVNAHTQLLWECGKGHQWEASPTNVKHGTWCPVCGGTKKLTLQDMQMLASEHGGKCLSQEYVNISTKLLWECKKGHQWKAQPHNIKHGRWCPECAGIRKLTIKEMQMFAKEQGGRCLSREYVNAHTKLLWECAEGHQWEAMPTNIQHGSWCPKCYSIRRANQRKVNALKRARESAFSRSL